MPDHAKKTASARIEGEAAFDLAVAHQTSLFRTVTAHSHDLGLDPKWLTRLCETCMTTTNDDHLATLKDMRRSGIDAVDIAEGYVPAAARVFGDQWCDDDSSFTDVTVGTSRLHQVLRAVADEWRGAEQVDPMTPSLLVLVESGTQHTMGATVLSGILRRQGYAVQLLVGAEAPDLAYHLEKTDHEVAFISASGRASIEMLRAFVEVLHDVKPVPIKVVIGGTIAKDGETTEHEILALTGADFFSDDPTEALGLCGLTTLRPVGTLAPSADWRA